VHREGCGGDREVGWTETIYPIVSVINERDDVISDDILAPISVTVLCCCRVQNGRYEENVDNKDEETGDVDVLNM
jgi:hypothetical protein